jgi:DNA processing protein
MNDSIGAVRLGDADYPPMLAAIDGPPHRLFYRGRLQALETPCIAVVGARHCTRDGRAAAERFAAHLSACGATVVSGLAHGIDTAAHEGALAAGGATAAVLGCGVDRVYPARNSNLAQRILAGGGALLSEYRPGTPPARHRFPERNRIISGLCHAVLVVEASERSGSLITARLALEQGRDVLAVPGAIGNATSAGCLRLIREGAALIDSLETLRFELGIVAPTAAPAVMTDAQQHLLACFDGGSASVDDLALRAAMPVSDVLALLAELELEGFVANHGDGYSRRPVF